MLLLLTPVRAFSATDEKVEPKGVDITGDRAPGVKEQTGVFFDFAGTAKIERGITSVIARVPALRE